MSSEDFPFVLDILLKNKLMKRLKDLGHNKDLRQHSLVHYHHYCLAAVRIVEGLEMLPRTMAVEEDEVKVVVVDMEEEHEIVSNWDNLVKQWVKNNLGGS